MLVALCCVVFTLFVDRYSLCADRCLLFVAAVCCLLFGGGCVMLAICCLMFAVWCLLVVVSGLLFVVPCVLFRVSCGV